MLQQREDKTTVNSMSIGFVAAIEIMNRWGLKLREMQAILRLKETTFRNYRNNPSTINLDLDQMDRLSYIINIHSALRIVFENPENVYGFMKMKNDNAFFEGRTPLSVIASGKMSDLYEVFCRIDNLRSGMWS